MPWELRLPPGTAARSFFGTWWLYLIPHVTKKALQTADPYCYWPGSTLVCWTLTPSSSW